MPRNRAGLRPQLHTIEDAVIITGQSRSTIYRLLGSGRLQGVKRGVRTFITADSIDEFIASLPKAKIRYGRGEELLPGV